MNSFRMVVPPRPHQDRRHGGGVARGGEIGQVCLRHGGGAAGGGEIDISMEQLAKYVSAVADPSAVSEAPAVADAPRGCGCPRSRGLAKQLVIPPLLPPPIDDPPSHEPVVEDVAAADADVEAMPTVVVPAAICHDAVVVWDRRVPGGEEYEAAAFGVQIEFSQWMSDLPRLRVAVLTFNGVCPNAVSERGPEELAIALVLGGFQLGVCFASLDESVVIAANELMINIARCGVQPKVLQEDAHQVVFQLEYPSASSAVAGRKPSSHSSAVAGSKPSCARSAVAGYDIHEGISYNNIAADLLTAFQRHAMLRIRDEFMTFLPKKYKKWRQKDGSLAIVGFPGQSAPLRTKPERAGRP